MCFDIDVNRLSMEELRDTLRRVSMVLSRPNIVNNLPDNGHQLRQAKEKLEKEIAFRESLEQTRKQIQKMSIRCASDSNIATSHNSKVCSFDRKPERERFKPHFSLKPSTLLQSRKSGKSESMKELRSGVKMLDLISSMSLQKEQEERVKSEQIKSKHERLMAYMMTKDLSQNGSDSDDDSSNPTNFGDDYDSENSDEDDQQSADEKKPKKDQPVYLKIDVQAVAVYDIDEPGPSHITVTVPPHRAIAKPKRKIRLTPCSSEPKVKAEEAEKKPQQEGDEMEVKQECDQVELKQKGDQVELKQEGDEMEVKQESDQVGLKQEGDKVELKQGGDKVELKQEVDKMEVKQDGDEMEVKYEGDKVELKQEVDQMEVKQDSDEMEVKHEGDEMEVKHEGDEMEVKQEVDKLEVKHEAEPRVYAGPSKVKKEKGKAKDLPGPKKLKSEVAKEASPENNEPGLP